MQIPEANIDLRDYITRTLGQEPGPSPDPQYDDDYHWEGDKTSLNADLSDDSFLCLNMLFGWVVWLDTADHIVHINFADTPPDTMPERLKTIVGHCVVSGIACENPWMEIPRR